jgi:predicted transcriptional regulator
VKKQPNSAKKLPRKLNTPESRQVQVIAKKMVGKTDSEIGRELGMSHHTIGKILTRTQYKDIIRQYQAEALELIAPSLRVYRRAVSEEAESVPSKAEGSPEEVGKTALQRMLEHQYRVGYKAGTDALSAARDSLKGTQVFINKTEFQPSEDPVDEMSLEQLESQLQVLYARKSQLEAV